MVPQISSSTGDFLRSLKQKIALLQHYHGLWQYCWWQVLSSPCKMHHCHHCCWATKSTGACTVTPTILSVSLRCNGGEDCTVCSSVPIINSPLWFYMAMQSILLFFKLVWLQHTDWATRILRQRVPRFNQNVILPEVPQRKAEKCILHLSTFPAGDVVSRFNWGSSESRADSEPCQFWTSLPSEVAFLPDATPSGRSSSSSDGVREMDRSLALLSGSCTSELSELELSYLSESKQSARYDMAYLKSSNGKIKAFNCEFLEGNTGRNIKIYYKVISKKHFKPGLSWGSFPKVVSGIKWLRLLPASPIMGVWRATSRESLCSAGEFLSLIGLPLLRQGDGFLTRPVKVTRGGGSCSSSLPKGTLPATPGKAWTDGSAANVLSCLSLKLQPSGESFEPEMSSDKCAPLLAASSPPTLKSFKRPLGRRSCEWMLRLGERCNAWCECTLVVRVSALDPLEVWRPIKIENGGCVKSSAGWERVLFWCRLRADCTCRNETWNHFGKQSRIH